MVAAKFGAAGDLNIDVLIAAAVTHEQFAHQFSPGPARMGIDETDGCRAAGEPVEVFVEAEWPALENGDDFVDSVAEQKTAI